MKASKILPLVLTVLAIGCGEGQKSSNNPAVTGLTTFSSCEDLANFLITNAGSTEPGTAGSSGGGSAEDNGSGSEPTAAPSSPTTVEEADIVKQEGNRLYIITSYNNGLLIYDVSDPDQPKRVGETTLSLFVREMHVEGTTVAVIGDPILTSPGPVDVSPIFVTPTTQVVFLNTSDPSSIQTIREFNLDGFYSDSRKIGNAIYLALQSWLPAIDKDQLLTALENEASCGEVYVPEDLGNGIYASYPIWDLVGLSLNQPNQEPEKVSVIGSYGSAIYSTPTHFYLTSYFYESQQSGIYLFDLDPETADAAPRAHNFVPGFILNQFSMDETNGIFRAASTQPPPPPPSQTTNYLTTFRANDGSLAQLGQIDSIVPGESITAARFIGDKGYVTTFVFTDPLVTIDLSNPSQPKVVGELHLPGSTNYIQGWGEDRLIAIGSNSTFTGGVLLNLFDVSDLANPKLVEQEPVEGAFFSEAQFDHLAFSFFEDKQIVAFPVYDSKGSSLRLFSVDRNNGFTPIGSITHDDLIASGDFSPNLRRSLDISDFLYSVSDGGLKVNAFSNLTTDLFEELFPGFTPPNGGPCGCSGDVCLACPEPL